MSKFDDLAADLGWIKPYSDIHLWYRPSSDLYTAVFYMADIYESYVVTEELLTSDIVGKGLEIMPTTKFKKESLDWVVPMLISDYFYHKRDFENELIWAKKTIQINPKINVNSFSSRIQDKL